jgi:hypothetical protein
MPRSLPSRRLPTRAILGLANVAIGAFVVGVELARPLFAPLLEALERLPSVRRVEEAIAGMPRHAILGLVAIPFLGAEPLKVLGAVLAFAYGASLVLVERIYAAGREKLLTIAWLAACIRLGTRVRDAVLARCRALPAWGAAAAAARSAGDLARRLLRRPVGAG